MRKVSLILLFLIFVHQLNVEAQSADASKNTIINKKTNSQDKKPIREYTRYDTIFTSYRKLVTGHKLKYGWPVRDTSGITYLITEKTGEVIKLENGIWKIWNKGIEEKPVFLHANSKGRVFAVAAGKGFGWKLYQLKDTVWNKISENFPTWPLTAGADGEFYCLKESKDANNTKYKTINIWKDNEWIPIEGKSLPQQFYEESIKLCIPPDGTIFVIVRQQRKEKESLVIHQWKNNEWKKIGEFDDKYIASSTQATDKLNRLYITYFHNEQTKVRRWDGNIWAEVQLPITQSKYANLSNNLIGELFIDLRANEQIIYHQREGDGWSKVAGVPKHIIPKFKEEVFPQIDGHYYQTEFGTLYDLGTEFTVRKRNLKEYPFVIPAAIEKILPANIKNHLSLFRLLEDNGKVGLASRSNDYEIIHAVFDSIRVEKSYMSETEFKGLGYTGYQPFVLALYSGSKSIEVNILALKWSPYRSDQMLEGTVTRITTCRKCNGTGIITERSIKSYTPGKSETIKIKDRYRSASGDLVEKTYSWTESSPSETTYSIKSGPCNCRDGKIENRIYYFFDIEKQSYRN
jgi:hypothetical protein